MDDEKTDGISPAPAADIYALGRTVMLAAAAAAMKLPRRLRRSLEKACEMNPALRHKSAKAWKRRLQFPHAIAWVFAAVVGITCFVCWHTYRAGTDLIHELGRYAEGATAENAALNPVYLDYYVNEEMVYPTESPLPPVADEYVRRRMAIWDDYLQKRGELYTEISARIKSGEDYHAAKEEHRKLDRKLRKETDDKLNEIYREYVEQHFEGATFLEKELKALISPKPRDFKGY